MALNKKIPLRLTIALIVLSLNLVSPLSHASCKWLTNGTDTWSTCCSSADCKLDVNITYSSENNYPIKIKHGAQYCTTPTDSTGYINNWANSGYSFDATYKVYDSRTIFDKCDSPGSGDFWFDFYALKAGGEAQYALDPSKADTGDHFLAYRIPFNQDNGWYIWNLGTDKSLYKKTTNNIGYLIQSTLSSPTNNTSYTLDINITETGLLYEQRTSKGTLPSPSSEATPQCLSLSDTGTVFDNGFLKLAWQGDGNLVLYTADWSPVWSTGTQNVGHNLCFQGSDGNLVIYDNNGNPKWASGTTTGQTLVLQTDCNLVIYDNNGNPKWASNTNFCN
ncbi:hypothetical protein [Shewanella surugensis]|uniref:Bulb-type lectin domain-containing protein n=1 Tax=Shewanella surugensis TaxID=212020 RepID=A0ABT0LI82_9GAMM|nr:hypothetical protein [Shewanella surugensis]MCL1127299.1 hypothetical protein [Shewanella surugensis]